VTLLQNSAQKSSEVFRCYISRSVFGERIAGQGLRLWLLGSGIQAIGVRFSLFFLLSLMM
jgi:hypothetical protein